MESASEGPPADAGSRARHTPGAYPSHLNTALAGHRVAPRGTTSRLATARRAHDSVAAASRRHTSADRHARRANMAFLEGKRALILGIASNRSIAWGIARAMHREGAELALTGQNERLCERVAKLAGEVGSNIVLECDVATRFAHRECALESLQPTVGRTRHRRACGGVRASGSTPGQLPGLRSPGKRTQSLTTSARTASRRLRRRRFP